MTVDSSTTVAVRMYNVGFGDAIRVTVSKGGKAWRMLVDCGAHPHCSGRGIRETVSTIIDELADECDDGKPHLDVVVATHRHRDHISGFALEGWSRVAVDEVWLPFTEDEQDPRATELRQQQARIVRRLLGFIEQRQRVCPVNSEEARMLETAHAFALNSSVNAEAMQRLMHIGKQGPRYFPSPEESKNTFQCSPLGVRARILGPPVTREMIRQMNPPTRARWLRLDVDEGNSLKSRVVDELFSAEYDVDESDVPSPARSEVAKLSLAAINDDGLLAAASFLERSINNTSLFFILEINESFRMLFPGDSQFGAWEHVRKFHSDLLSQVDFYKIGHHGSHNATPKDFATEWVRAGDAMLPWGVVERWKDSIPHPTLLSDLGQHHAIVGHDGLHAGKSPCGSLKRSGAWTELTFSVA